ncbi:hypothetical protein SAMN05660649_04940 [Desulfotomaculum arcticum]|uniref:LPXTG cell wall anchor domain-containing protein n=1 Tax=Desulfotruncus arcticus DSM 17038 TaxID=1121424 RepID=A0A1I2ZH83_9FIRM|nr:hypothetical protein [Desulfotruncus arcticus]SFH37090.1 hypothetical protein SAMN05660649_04940 [Desulfotomaculum arcticum] [Desulfotruncus arcticus DSM 17038]
MELKTILAVVLCLVIVGGAVYLHKRKKNNGPAEKGRISVPFLLPARSVSMENG